MSLKPFKILGIVIIAAVIFVVVAAVINNLTVKNNRLSKVSGAFQTANQQFKNPLTTLGAVDSLDAQATCHTAGVGSEDGSRTDCSKQQGGDVVITSSNTTDLTAKLSTIDSLAGQSGWHRSGMQPVNYLQSLATAGTTYQAAINGQLCSFRLSNIANNKTLEEGPTAHILRISIGCQKSY